MSGNHSTADFSELWIDIPGFGGYQASTLGRVRSTDRYDVDGKRFLPGQVLKCYRERNGYLRAVPYIDGKRRRLSVHKLIALAFIGPCPNGLQVNHRNGIKIDNRPENLEYVSASHNSKHAFESGLRSVKSGEETYNHKLT